MFARQAQRDLGAHRAGGFVIQMDEDGVVGRDMSPRGRFWGTDNSIVSFASARAMALRPIKIADREATAAR